MTLSRKILFSPLAESDIDRQAAYLESVRTNLGREFLGAVRVQCDELAKQPTSGTSLSPLVDFDTDISVCPTRQFRNHLIFYRSTDQELIVMRLLHSGQDWASMIKPQP